MVQRRSMNGASYLLVRGFVTFRPIPQAWPRGFGGEGYRLPQDVPSIPAAESRAPAEAPPGGVRMENKSWQGARLPYDGGY